MTEGKKTHGIPADDLRRRAEEIDREKAAQSPENIGDLSPEKARQVLHELRVHQIELEMQNEHLRRTQGELEASRARYFDLYDLAPVGYCTLSEKGLILEANLTAATLLGAARGALVKQPITRFIFHDFNNMLAVILGHAEMALLQVDPAQPLHADLEEIRTAAERSANLTRQLLAFARKQTVAPKVLDLNETVAGMLKLLQRLIGENIHLTWQPGANLWPVRVDPSQIDQILANLCVNARDAIADVGTITIETGNAVFDEAYCAAHPDAVPGEYVRLAVSDTGCGMDQDTLAHIFEPFFTTKGVGKGTGLGLATVYGIVKQNNGFITVYSEPGQRTTFTIYLPRQVGKAEQARLAGAAEPALRGQETILLVEDEPVILELTTVMLERQGYTVLAASTPGEAIRLARERAGNIHLLMTDVVMPEMNGRDLAKNLLSLYPQLKHLFMSGYTANVIAYNGVLDEGVYFIQKPFSIKGLAAKVREALDHEKG
jgi:signal transduction histidine kinase/ActR/RegA family two-component response regulator